MKRVITHLILLGGFGLAATGCATKGWVQGQLTPTNTRLSQVSQRVDQADRRIDETSSQVAVAQQSIEETRGRVQGLDGRVGEATAAATQAGAAATQAGAAARDASRTADEALVATRDVDERLSQRIASRNKYATVEVRSVYFDFGKADLKDEGINALQDLAQALKADPNAVLELAGYTDSRGDDRYNLRLSRERVDAVVRHLVQKLGVDLRRIHAAGLGKAIAGGQKVSSGEAARARRVDIRLLAPQA